MKRLEPKQPAKLRPEQPDFGRFGRVWQAHISFLATLMIIVAENGMQAAATLQQKSMPLKNQHTGSLAASHDFETDVNGLVWDSTIAVIHNHKWRCQPV